MICTKIIKLHNGVPTFVCKDESGNTVNCEDCKDCCEPPLQLKDNLCVYIEKSDAIRPFGNVNGLGTGPITNFAGSTLDGFIQGTWETTTPTYGSGPLQFGGVTNWYVSMFNTGSGIYNNTMRLNLWSNSGCIVKSGIRMTDIDSPNGTNQGEKYNISGLNGYSSLNEYTFTGSPAYYPFGTYTPVVLGTQGTLFPNGDYCPNNTTSGAGLEATYTGGFSNQIITASTDQGGQSVVWMPVTYLSPIRVEKDCETGVIQYWDDYNYDIENPYDTDGNPILTSVLINESDIILKPCCETDKPDCCSGSFNPYSDCDIETTTVIRCVDGDQTVMDVDGNSVMLTDNDEIAYNTLICDNTVTGFSIVSINNSTVQIALPAPGSPTDNDPQPFNTKTCDPNPELFGPICKVDEKGSEWSEFQIVSTVSGTTFIYIDSNGNTGIPNGDLTECAGECCPIIVENCACLDGEKINIQYGVYPDNGVHVGWYINMATGLPITGIPEWVDCCKECASPVCNYTVQFTGEPFTLTDISAINTSTGLLSLPNYVYDFQVAADRTQLQTDLANALGIPIGNVSLGLNRVSSTITVIASPIVLTTIQSNSLFNWVQSNCV